MVTTRRRRRSGRRKLTTARPISAPYSSSSVCRGGEPSRLEVGPQHRGVGCGRRRWRAETDGAQWPRCRAASPSAEGRPGGRRTRRRPRRRPSPRSARVADASARDGSHRRADVRGLVALGLVSLEKDFVDPGCAAARGCRVDTSTRSACCSSAPPADRWSPTSGAANPPSRPYARETTTRSSRGCPRRRRAGGSATCRAR